VCLALTLDAPSLALAQPTTTTDVIVTGSRLPRAEAVGVSPVVSTSASEIEFEGAVRVEDVLNQLPQIVVDQDSHSNNPATGAATVNLRGLGSERTLVLIDGRRVAPGDPTSGEVAPDLNFIPSSLVDHIDVLTGGASAVYGSDAIAGVVNFILKKDFTGIRLDAEASGFEHGNGDTAADAALAASGARGPSSTVFDGQTYDVNVVAGTPLLGGAAHLTVYAGYRWAAAVTENTRDFSACVIVMSFSCVNSTRSPQNGRFEVFDPATFNEISTLTLDPTGSGNSFRPFNAARDAFNPASDQYFQRPDTRYTTGGFFDWRPSSALHAYVQVMLMEDDTSAQLAPSGLFGQQFNIACSNPLLSVSQVQALCGAANLAASDEALVFIGRRNVEGGARRYTARHQDYRLLAGASGELGAWTYDISLQTSGVQVKREDMNDVSLTRAADALNVVQSASGAVVCASGAKGCAPYDIFQVGGVTTAALNYIEAQASSKGATRETVASANASVKLERYGLRSPFADEGPTAAIGAEFRRESLSYSPDAELASGDLAGAGIASPAVAGSFSVAEAYGEVRLPLAQQPEILIHALDVEAGVRYSRYQNAGEAWTSKLGVEWAPTADLTWRAGFNRAVRAPNVVDLFTPVVLNRGGLLVDPCAGANPITDNGNPYATAANCARTGVTAAQYGAIVSNPDGYNSLEGGNNRLKPETADTFTAGVVLTPKLLSGFRASVDYFDIRIAGVVATLGADTIVEQCLQTGASNLCSLIHRSPTTGSLWLGSDGYVDDGFQNAAALRTRGVDFDASYTRALALAHGLNLGSMALSLRGSYLASFSGQSERGQPSVDCAGLYGEACGGPYPRWRHILRATWSSAWPLTASVAWRYVGPVKVDALASNPILNGAYPDGAARIGSWSAFDVGLHWRVNAGLTLRAGVDNIFDADPPLNVLSATNGNTNPGLYDALGRYVFVGLTAAL
jgi:outer membrane receptor protein involved in Fe transport